ncbi:ankyrin repeat-containing domain protein, partial [Kalaharituber pfeilii]
MDINVFDGEGRTPLAWAAWRGDEELVGMLLSEELHGRVAWSPLARAAETGDQDSVRYLLAHVGAETTRTWLTQSGRTPFWLACRNGHRGVIRAIMEHVHAVDVNAGPTPYQTPMCLSKFDGHVRIIRHLLSQLPAGAVDPNCEDGSGETPLYKAADAGPPVLARALLDAAHGRIDPDKKTSRGDTPLCVAARRDHDEVVEMLLGLAGANPAVADADGNTPLMCAAIRSSERSLHVLLAHPVARKTADIPNKGGVTPLSVLCSDG